MALGFSKAKQVGKREPKEKKPMKKVSKKQAKRIKKLAEIPPPEDGLCEE